MIILVPIFPQGRGWFNLPLTIWWQKSWYIHNSTRCNNVWKICLEVSPNIARSSMEVILLLVLDIGFFRWFHEFFFVFNMCSLQETPTFIKWHFSSFHWTENKKDTFWVKNQKKKICFDGQDQIILDSNVEKNPKMYHPRND